VRVVLDNNVLVSALLSPLGAPAQILAAYRAGRLGLVTGDKHLHEAPVVAPLTAAQIEVVRPAEFVRALQLLQPNQTGDLFIDWDIEP
jgi:predicted nucleic acid-binding protein